MSPLDSPNGTGRIRAADRGFVAIVRALLATSMAVDHVNEPPQLDGPARGDHPRRRRPRHTKVVRLLVAAGANVNLADRAGVSPLQHAHVRGFSGTAAILEAAGAR